MKEQWTGHIIGRMHNEGVTYEELGAELGICKGYVSMILNGRRKPDGIRNKMEAALNRIIEEKRKNRS